MPYYFGLPKTKKSSCLYKYLNNGSLKLKYAPIRNLCMLVLSIKILNDI